MVEADFIHNQGIVGGEIDAKVEAVCKLEHAARRSKLTKIKRVQSQFKDGEEDARLCK